MLCGNPRLPVRSCIIAMAQAITSASLARALFLSACATVLKQLRTTRDAAVSVFDSKPLAKAGVTARVAVRSGMKKTTISQQGLQGNKQRSKKGSRKSAPVPAPLVQRGMTAGAIGVSPTVNPKSVQNMVGDASTGKASDVAHAKEEGAYHEGVAGEGRVDSSKAETDSGVVKNEAVVRNGDVAKGDKGVISTVEQFGVDSPPEREPPGTAEAAVKLATEIAARVAFPDVMTAEQVQAIVEEDERAWEQARSTERQETTKAEDGWSEVGGGTSSGSRGRDIVYNGRGSGGVLSLQNVHAASRGGASQAPPRACSPGSDPATTTSASSSDGSEGNEERKPNGNQINIPRPMPSQHRGRENETKDGRAVATGRAGNRPVTRTVKGGGGTVSRASGAEGNKAKSLQTRGGGSSSVRGSGGSVQIRSVRPQPVRGSQVHLRAHSIHLDAASSRHTRPSYAGNGRANSAPQLTQRPSGGGGKVRKSPGQQVQKVLRAVPGGESGRGKNASPWKVLPSLSVENPSDKVTQRSVPSESRLVDSAAAEGEKLSKEYVGVVEKEAGSEATEEGGETEAAAVEMTAPVAWTNSPSHPLGMKVEQQPLPPASQPPRPPPSHQPHWERQQIRQQQQQQQLYYHEQHQQMMTMPPAPSMQQQQQEQVVGGHSHHFSTQSVPPHQGPYEQQYPHQHEIMMPQYLPPPADDMFPPPPSSTINAAAGVAPPLTVVTAPIMYPPHANIHASSPSSVLSPGEDGIGGEARFHSREGSYDSAGGEDGGSGSALVPGTAGYLPDAAPVIAPAAPMVLISPPQQQQHQPSMEGVNVVAGQYVGSHGVGYGLTSTVGDEATEALIGMLCWQVEYYFSVENLIKDSYLRGLMDADGYVAVSQVRVFSVLGRIL